MHLISPTLLSIYLIFSALRKGNCRNSRESNIVFVEGEIKAIESKLSELKDVLNSYNTQSKTNFNFRLKRQVSHSTKSDQRQDSCSCLDGIPGIDGEPGINGAPGARGPKGKQNII